MTNASQPKQATLDGSPDPNEPSTSMLVRVNAMAVKLVYPFIAQNDIRYYLNGINIRPLEDDTVMLVATDGHRYIVARDLNGFAEKEVVVSISKDALKHAANAKHTLDVMSNGSAMISDEVAQPLCVKSDYCNASGLEVMVGFIGGEPQWVEWDDPETGDEIDEYASRMLAARERS